MSANNLSAVLYKKGDLRLVSGIKRALADISLLNILHPLWRLYPFTRCLSPFTVKSTMMSKNLIQGM